MIHVLKDCWGLGVLLYAMLSGTVPFGTDENMEELKKNIRKGKVDFCEEFGWENVSMEAKDLILRLLERDPLKRISIKDCFCHPWIQRQANVLNEMYARRLKI
jgi:serine/threonine protein kinase